MANRNKSQLKNNTRKSTTNRQNPLTQAGTSRPKMNMNFDGQFLNGSQFLAPMVTLVNQATGLYALDCSNNNTTGIGVNAYVAGVSYGLIAISSVYNEYVYRSVRFDWLPYVSPSSADGGSQIYVGYVDNAEEISGLSSASIASAFNTSKAIRNMRFFNAWERFSYTVPLTRRRKIFDVNVNASYSNADTVDRSVQGAVVVGVNSVSAAASLGQWRVTYLLELRGLDTLQST